MKKKTKQAGKKIYKRRKSNTLHLHNIQEGFVLSFVASIKLYILINTLFLNNKLHS